ncbi:hypothetical protein VaNZ11_011943 [Volvox africanus]|uniref:Uncharacterized protein n=1 Tax=Volvox africanus TaxID=51714 RepID=A0ABQ5SCS8_9CHLO|nr:hypothetical protein VaNZ11_011943 [Volvox africanus]
MSPGSLAGRESDDVLEAVAAAANTRRRWQLYRWVAVVVLPHVRRIPLPPSPLARPTRETSLFTAPTLGSLSPRRLTAHRTAASSPLRRSPVPARAKLRLSNSLTVSAGGAQRSRPSAHQTFATSCTPETGRRGEGRGAPYMQEIMRLKQALWRYMRQGRVKAGES